MRKGWHLWAWWATGFVVIWRIVCEGRRWGCWIGWFGFIRERLCVVGWKRRRRWGNGVEAVKGSCIRGEGGESVRRLGLKEMKASVS
jgi:hypothetical protein